MSSTSATDPIRADDDDAAAGYGTPAGGIARTPCPPGDLGAAESLTAALRGHRAVVEGDVDVSVTVSVRGEIDSAALARVRDMFEGLTSTTSPIVVDLDHARCGTGRLLAELCALRDRRARAGLCTTLQGLHPGVIPDLEAVELTEVFLAYRDAHTRRPAPDHRQAG
ncbi:hypothetical protein LQ327_17230 [Actinomycetospora endophytica]|uniref:Anti-anti-sigma factor n=1 Tax=Actinomycetospora endophytica TaxID=2291215 RepID=A0ABS8PB08_9PSEU|nr:hypothetical protein [Actinomycetospora endophytica]MCD2195112.1 hypothetical protein [Actinomycetospora endophytica]